VPTKKILVGLKFGIINLIIVAMIAGIFYVFVQLGIISEPSKVVTNEDFKRPIFYGDRLTVVGEVTSKNDSLEIITLKTEIFKNHEAVITGEAKVKVLTDD